MSFVDTYFRKLRKTPNDSNLFTWADYLELLCISNIDGELSKSDIIDQLAPRQSDLKEGVPEDIQEEEAIYRSKEDLPPARSQIADRWEMKVNDWFKMLTMRESLYGSYYPFIITEKEIKLKEAKPDSRQNLYLFLLFCSNLYLFGKQKSTLLTSSFEILSLETFKKVLPSFAEVHLFGKNPLNKSGKFQSKFSLWKKINQLASELNEKISQKIQQSEYPNNNTGDDGLDIVAWIPTPDDLPSKIIFFAQCACGDNWKNKQHESSFERWNSKIELTSYPLNTIFIPYCYRKENGGWHRPGDIEKTFLMDRNRILHFAHINSPLSHKILPAAEFVSQIYEAKNTVF